MYKRIKGVGMPSKIEVATTDKQLQNELNRYRDLNDMGVGAVMSELGKGLLHFTGVAFPGAKTDNLLVQKFEREADGRGPHFDLYEDYLDKKYPWVGLLNLSGVANVETVKLPDDLSRVYFSRYTEPSDKAFDARRPLSIFALKAPEADISVGKLNPGTGFFLPQRSVGPHIVHDIKPAGSIPGEFIKALVAKDESIEFLNGKGYVTLDDFTTESAGGAKRTVRSFAQATQALRAPRRTPEPYRHPCNLD